MTALVFALFAFWPAQALEEICEDVFIDSDENFGVSKNDKVFICGDEKSPAWSQIPLNQKKYHIGAVLERSGYYSPKFEMDGGRLVVHPGEKTEISDVRFESAPTEFTKRVRRRSDRGALTPNKLKEIESWSLSRLQTMGYPCPAVTAFASSKSGEIRTQVDPGPKLNVVEIKRPDDKYREIYKRYDAFHVGERFNQNLLELTSRRIMLADIAQYAYFEVECRPEGAVVHQKTILGQSRSLSFSVGSSTEEAVITRVEWKNTRLGDEASNLSAEIAASPRKQMFLATSQLYLIDDWTYTFFVPEVSLIRESEGSYEVVKRRIGALIGHTEDSETFRYHLKAGPYYNDLSTLRGVGPRESAFVTWEGEAIFESHDHEFFRVSPRDGYLLNFNYKSQRRGLASDLNADQFTIGGTILENVKDYDPPFNILGLRFSVTTTQVKEGQISLLPEDYRLRLGGDDNIRGFARKTIDNGDRGYITTAYAGLEWRFNQRLPYQLQPFVFIDYARVGNRSFQLERTQFWSPGLGVRWPSLIGSFRATAAKGDATDIVGDAQLLPQEWVYFLSYGREF